MCSEIVDFCITNFSDVITPSVWVTVEMRVAHVLCTRELVNELVRLLT